MTKYHDQILEAIKELKEASAPDAFGCNTGDCAHDHSNQCADAYRKQYLETANRIDALASALEVCVKVIQQIEDVTTVDAKERDDLVNNIANEALLKAAEILETKK